MSEQPKRLTLSQIVEMLLTRSGSRESSVSIGRTASGETVFDVKVYAAEDETHEQAEARAQESFDRLAAKYPRTDAHDDAKVTFSRTAKGDTQVAVEAHTSPAIATLEELELAARKAYDKARMQYPMDNGMSAKPGSVKA